MRGTSASKQEAKTSSCFPAGDLGVRLKEEKGSAPLQEWGVRMLSSQLCLFRLHPLGLPGNTEAALPPAPPPLPENLVVLHISELLGPVATRP